MSVNWDNFKQYFSYRAYIEYEQIQITYFEENVLNIIFIDNYFIDLLNIYFIDKKIILNYIIMN